MKPERVRPRRRKGAHHTRRRAHADGRVRAVRSSDRTAVGEIGPAALLAAADDDDIVEIAGGRVERGSAVECGRIVVRICAYGRIERKDTETRAQKFNAFTG